MCLRGGGQTIGGKDFNAPNGVLDAIELVAKCTFSAAAAADG